MIKMLVFFTLLAGFAFGLSQLADLPGHLLLQLGDTQIKVTLLVAFGALIALILSVMLFWAVLRVMFRLPGIMALGSRMRRQAKGQNALARGMIAVGNGDARLAQRFADESERLMGKQPLALLLKAQAAQLSGNGNGAETAFKSMLETPETQSLGLRGLFVEAERRGDRANARLFAEQAYRQMPDAPWASSAMLGFRASERDWRGAIGIVDQNVSRRLQDRNEGKTQRAILLAACALDLHETRPDEALGLAQDALRSDPSLVPAAALAARKLSMKVILAKPAAFWKPHGKRFSIQILPMPISPFARVISALDRLKRARNLQKLAPNARESRFAIARAALDAREFAAARDALETLALEKASVRTCLLMAELEERESGNMGLVRSWLARASVAPRDPVWIADGVISDHWAPCSPVTGRIGAFEWKEPPHTIELDLRARIDADRFMSIPALDIAPTPDTPNLPVTTLPVATADTMMPHASAQAEPAVKPIIDATAIIPDDPGPEGTPPEKRGFRFFG